MQPINIINGSWKQGVEPKVVNLTGTAFMEEAGAHVFHISAEDASGAAIAFTGTVSALFLRADNTTVAIDGEISEGAAEITLVSDCYHVPGRFSIAIYVSDGTDSACVYAAVGNVYRTSSDVVIDSGATIPTLAQLQAAYQACVEATEDAEAAALTAVTYAAQTGQTDAQKEQARDNIGAASEGEISDLKSAVEVLEPAATEADVGKALIAKTVADGKVTEYEFGKAGGGADLDSIVTVEQNLTGADSSNRKMLMQKDAPFETELTARDYRRIGYVNVMRGAADITKWVYADGEIGVDCAFDDLRVEVIAPDKVPAKTVDICLFSGQSNMSGRGDATQATVCPAGEGYWWHNNQFEQIVDPVGNEGPSTGTMIPAICKAYYDTTNVPIVAVVNAIGGTNIAYWQPDTGAYSNSVNWVNAAKTYAQQNGYTVRHVIMCWCQGENDVADGTTKADYKAAFITMCDGLTEDAGIELFFNIKIGQHKTDATKDFTAIRAAQDELCQENPNYINVSDKFRGAPMKDAWHYNQPELNLTGRDAGINMGYYMLTGVKPLYPSYNFGDVFDQNVASSESFDLTGWTYSEGNTGLSLVKYNGTEKSMSIPAATIAGGYATPVLLNVPSNLQWGFQGNTTIEEVSIDANVQIMLNGSSTYQIISGMFKGCTALKKVTSLPTQNPDASVANRAARELYSGCTNITQVVFPANATAMKDICKSCTFLTEVPEIPQTATDLQAAFYQSGIEHLPDIPDSVTTIHTIVYNSTALKSIGKIGKGVTNVNDAFRFCPNLAGTVHIDAEDITFTNKTFSSSAIPNITFEVPAGSTTYTSLIAAYPSANVTTFTPD